MSMTFKFEGGAALARTLNDLPLRLKRSVVKEILFEVAEPMRAKMARLAGRGETAPHMADNIVISGGRGGVDKFGDEKEQSVAVGPAKLYKGSYSRKTKKGKANIEGASYQAFLSEYGTKDTAAKPVVRPAFESEAPKVIPALVPKIWRELAAKGIQKPMQTSDAPVSGGPGGSTL